VTDFLDEKRDEIDDRLAELKPLVEEYNRLLAAAAALRGIDGLGVAGAVVDIPGPVPSAASAAPSVESAAPSGSRAVPSGSRVALGGSRGVEEEAPSAEEEIVGTSTSAGNGDGVSSAEAEDAEDGEGAVDVPPAPRLGGGVRRAGRPKGSGTRAAEALRIVREHPGVTIPELADRMGIKQNYLYRVLPELVQEGKIAKQGRGWHPRAA
jgi:hypothetical protein